MTTTGPSSYKVVKHDDKIEALKSFIDAAVARLGTVSRSPTAITLIARSAASPVAQALLTSTNPAVIAISPRVVFTQSSGLGGLALSDALLASLGRQFRCLNDARYLDAHEQLVLAADSCWIGDCMRRDPMKRDAFEKFADGCTVTAGFAMTSFERFWRTGRPMQQPNAASSNASWSKATDGADSLLATAVAGEIAGERPPVLANTRH